MIKYLTELLSDINKDPDLIHKHMKDTAFSIIMNYAFDPDKKMNLPEGAPDYRKDRSPMGLNPTNLRYESKRLYVFCRGDISQLKRETLFIQLLESIHPDEAEILLAIKDQQLSRIYPNINHKLMSQFGICSDMEEEKPNRVLSKSEEPVEATVEYVDEKKAEEPVVVKTSRGRGRPKKVE